MCGTVRKAMKGRSGLESQLKLYKTMAVPIAVCGSETWVVIKNHEIRI
jgi:hypothetical protein